MSFGHARSERATPHTYYARTRAPTVCPQSPAQRWVLDESTLLCRHGGFLPGAQCFDNAHFGIAPAEVEAMDPQQRLLLELGYEALRCTGQRRASLLGSSTGAYVGIEHIDWQLLQVMETALTALQRASVYAASGEQGHVASGRLAYALDLRGPCMSVNTACSSALVVAHAGASALRADECSRALAAGVKLILLPFVGAQGILATDGRSKSFDARADGYGRSEAIGAAQLDADARVLAELRGSAVQSDGRSASLSAPNGVAQRMTIEQALARGSVAPAELGSIQPQGLGSSLADPIEMSAVAAALGAAGPSCLAVGCHKANAGHSEASSGLLGLVTAQHLFQSASVAGNAQLRALNAMVKQGLRDAQVLFATNATSAPRRAPTACGVTAFGVSGTIAHAVLEAGRAGALGVLLDRAASSPHYKRRAFGWYEPVHPLMQRRLPGYVGAVASFRSPADGALHALVADHVVHGRVIFPGAAYLEMARVACRAIVRQAARATSR